MEDVQSHAPDVALSIDRVGVRGITVPLRVRDRARGHQDTVARVDLGGDLPSSYKGTHMSRFVEALEAWDDALDAQSVRRLLGLCAFLFSVFPAQGRAVVGHSEPAFL